MYRCGWFVLPLAGLADTRAVIAHPPYLGTTRAAAAIRVGDQLIRPGGWGGQDHAVVLDVLLAKCLRHSAIRADARRVPETFVMATHARVQDMLGETVEQVLRGCAAAVVVRADSSVWVAGRPSDGNQDAA
jgi:hypothetical protein